MNGRIEAVGRSFHLSGDTTEHFALNVPEAALRDGRNRIELYEVTPGGTGCASLGSPSPNTPETSHLHSSG